MADLIPFRLKTAAGADLLGAAVAYTAAGTDFRTRAGVARTPAPLTEIGLGLYGCTPTDADKAIGVVGIIDGGVLAVPRYTIVFQSAETDPFQAVLITDDAGALYALANLPTLGAYKSAAGADLAQPSRVAVAGNYAVSFTPSAADLVGDVAWTLTAPAGGNLSADSGGFDGVVAAATGIGIGSDLRTALAADPTVASLVGTKIFPNKLPQGTTLGIVYQVISDVPENTFGGTVAETLGNARVQIKCYAKTYLQAHAVADAVDAVVSALATPGLSCWRVSRFDLYDDPSELHGVSMDFSCWS